jgi:hypothetical protein
MKVVGLGAHPGQKAGEVGIILQALHVVEPPCEFGFAESGMDSTVADLVEAHGALVSAALQAGREVMAARPGVGWDRALAKRADVLRVTRCHSLVIAGSTTHAPSGPSG